MRALISKIFLCLISIFYTANIFAYIYTVTVLEREGKKVFLLGDAHNLGSFKENEEQLDTLYSFCSELGLEKCQLLYESALSYDFSYVGLKKPSSKFIGRSEEDGSFQYNYDIQIPLEVKIDESGRTMQVPFVLKIKDLEVSFLKTFSPLAMILSDKRFLDFSKSIDPRLWHVIETTDEESQKNLLNDGFFYNLPLFTYFKLLAFEISFFDRAMLLSHCSKIFMPWQEKWKDRKETPSELIQEIKKDFGDFESPETINRILDVDAGAEILREASPKYSVVLVGEWHAENLVEMLESVGFTKRTEIGRDIKDISLLLHDGSRLSMKNDPRYYKAQEFLTSFEL